MMILSTEQVLKNYLTIKEKISQITNQAKLLAVSKFHGMDKIAPLIKNGHRIFGESRLEEAVEKWSEVRKQFSDIELHYIGGIQSRKISKIVEFFDVIQSVDKLSVAEKISATAKELGKCQRIYIQINIGNEPQKSGVPPSEFEDLYFKIKNMENIHIEGIMCIPPNEKDVSLYFIQMKELASKVGSKQLSMGMSHDYELALHYGATIVRVGSFIFGERSG
ncbi:YggS family pyridoxal phosphate-dependent enzyme [Erwinia pyri]|uniref:Pyridoxal phosphate homeostasis protein n=1 Tax=Erwinia pyri TaxID=3062598 RepID=A0AA50HP20_9GAMM|nr:YggS family pyridoxal phosphate-dependent enzyme [Erwinia sp. DE2]WLS79837.1 YggS family pyridoxal phosphate-dependent enzyme [Erwinia sp. DE2]